MADKRLKHFLFAMVLGLGFALTQPANAQTPSIITQPASQSSAVGGTIQFTVSATGGGTLAYQWRKNGSNMVNGVVSGAATISGATTTAVTLTTVTTNDQANYTCRITNSSGSITSSIASLTVVVSPNITTQPKSANTNVGSTVAFTVVASGTAPFTYQWYKDASPISGATLNAYSISGLFISDSGTYNVRVSNAAGTITSSNAVLNVGIVAAITSQPSSLIVTQGQSASFSITATGTPLNYYWKKNGTFIPGQTNASLAFASTVPTNAATYTCQVSNFLGNVTSAGAVLTVYYPPTITIQPVGKTVGVGSNFTVSVTASGVPAIAYQWRTNGTAITGANASSYTVTGAQTNHAGSYDVVITNSLGSITSSVANISIVYYPPNISQQPIGGNVVAGNGFVLSTSATGTAPISWQWFKDGLAISNAAAMTTNLTGLVTFAYTNNSAQIVDSGNYQVVLENSSGSATSSVAVVNVGYAPVVVQQPISATNILGGANTFSCVVTGSVPINVQWTLNGSPLPGATNATLILTNLQPVTIGYYTLTATNIFGGTVSSNASLHLTGYDFGVWNGLVAYYPFNGNADDASGHGNDGTNFGAVLTADRLEASNSAYGFNGSSSVITFSAPPLTQVDNWTLSAWVNPASLSQERLAVMVGFDNASTGDGYGFGFAGNSTWNGIFSGVGGGWISSGYAVPSTNRWYHVVMLRQAGTTKFFVDGTQTLNISSTTPKIPSSFRIGSQNGIRFFNGQVDDVRIYNRALSSNEVTSLYALEADLPVISQQPQVQTANVGGKVTFTVTATANHPLSYQWFKDGFALNNATNTSLTLSNLQPNQIGYYSVAVSNGVAGVPSTNAALSLNGYNFTEWQGLVAYYPFNGNANDESSNGLDLVNNGTTLQPDRFGFANKSCWLDGSTNLASGNVFPVVGNSPRTVSAWCYVTNLQQMCLAQWGTQNYGTDTRFYILNTGQLFFNGFYADVTSAAVVSSGKWFHVVYTYSNSLSDVCIYLNGNRLTSSITSQYVSSLNTTPNTLLNIGNDEYSANPWRGALDDIRIYNRALSSNEVASLYSMEADVPIITQQPQPLTINAGGTASFSALAIANHALTYQWFKDGIALNSATNTSLTLSNIQPNQIGFYSVAVSNGVAGVPSTNAALSLNGYNFTQWQGLVAYYPFNGNANDVSGFGNNGLVNGAIAALDRFGLAASAYAFNGINSYIDCGTNISLGSPAGQFTVSTWFKSVGAGSIFSDYDAPSGGDGIFAVNLALHGTGQVETDTRAAGQDYDVFSTRTSLGNQWHQAVYIMDGSSNLLLYIDGQLDHTTAYIVALDYNSNPHWRIGANKFAGAINDYFSGSIDDVRLYNRALSSIEVASLYSMEADVPVITQQPQAQTANAGSMVTFNVAATANNPLTYQWRKNGAAITGATNSVLTFSNVQAANVGFYSVTVSNVVAGVSSTTALLNLTGFADPTWKGLVAYYPFVGNANDSSGHGLNFSSTPDLSADRFGQPAMSASFSTPNAVSTASIALNNQGLGLSLWVKLTRLPSPTAERVLMHGSWNLADGLFSIAFWQDGRGGIAFQDSNGQSHDVTAAAGTFSTNRWYNLIFTGDGTNVAMFINGSFYGALSGTLATKTAPIILGGDAGYYFSSGLIDDIRIYNRALSADEVAYLYLQESQSTLQPPQSLSASLGAGPNLSINLTGLPGRSYALQTATNLLPPIQWLPVLTNAADTNGVWQFMDTNLNSAQKFYRVTTP